MYVVGRPERQLGEGNRVSRIDRPEDLATLGRALEPTDEVAAARQLLVRHAGSGAATASTPTRSSTAATRERVSTRTTIPSASQPIMT